MTKMIPWKVSGVGDASRHAARAAARQNGTSVGDWLDRLIYERAEAADRDDAGMDERDGPARGPARRGPAWAGPAWSEGIARRAADLDAGDEGEPLVPRFIRQSEDDDAPLRRRATPARHEARGVDEDAIHLLAEAAGEMERRAAQVKRPAGPAEDRLGRLEARLGDMASQMERVLVEIQSQRQGHPAPEPEPMSRTPEASAPDTRTPDARAPGALDEAWRLIEDFVRHGQARARESESLSELERKLRRAGEAVQEARYAERPARFTRPAPTPLRGDATSAALIQIYDVLEIIAGELIASGGRSGRFDRTGRR